MKARESVMPTTGKFHTKPNATESSQLPLFECASKPKSKPHRDKNLALELQDMIPFNDPIPF